MLRRSRFCVWIRCWVSAKDYVGHALEIPLEVQQLVNDREEARKQKGLEAFRRLRVDIEKLGYVIEDTADGSKVKKAKDRGGITRGFFVVK